MRNVIVTGGSRGLGLGIACKLAGAGFRIITIARKESCQLASAMADGKHLEPGSLHFIPFDLADIDHIGGLVKTVRKRFGAIYGLVNNAAVGTGGVLANMGDGQIKRLVQLNTVSPFLLTKYVLRSMMADGGGGRVVNVASIVSFTGYSGLAVYGGTKASMVGFTRSLAREVGRLGINVNAVAPGFVQTDMTQDLREDQREQIARRSALHRLADVEDVANAVEFLMGEKSKNITGIVLTVDAGSTA